MISKTTIFIMVAFILTWAIQGQEFQGVATYKSHRKIDLQMDNESKNPELQKQIQEQMRQQFQQEYTLTFNRQESLYKKSEKLAKPNPVAGGITIQVSDGSDLVYKNIKENRFTNKTEMFGKLFLIKDSLQPIQWQLVNETKNIGDYTCFKATFTEEYNTQTFSADNKLETVIKERTTTAWYTPQIPVSNGPANFYGLPGLILEINDGELTLICSKIVLNPSEKVDIQEPSKGKVISQQEFEAIREKKTKEMLENFQSKKGDGNVIMIKAGG